MKDEYRIYIQNTFPDKNSAYGKCEIATVNMQMIFPELKRVRGHVDCCMRGVQEHWWLKDGDEIVDPTKAQFMIISDDQYKEWDEGREEPTGKCGNCGDYCYGGEHCCSDECSKIVLDYMNSI